MKKKEKKNFFENKDISSLNYYENQGIASTNFQASASNIYDKNKTKVPIKRGCRNEVCYCTGQCNEIIGWRDKIPGEL